MLSATVNLRPSILPRGRSPAHTRGPSDRPRGPRPASPPRPARCASIVPLDDLRESTGKPSRPSRNCATATSLAAFSTTGRLRSASSARYASRRHGNAVRVRHVELEPAGAREIERRQRRRPALGIRERVLNRQPHVGDAELRDDRAVDELDHRVHDRLRMDHDVDLIGARRRTASAPRSPRGPCSSASPNRW